MITGTFRYPSLSAAYFLRWPEIISYTPSGLGRTIKGLSIPYFLMLSWSSIIWLSACTLNGWLVKDLNLSSSISTIFSPVSRCSVFSAIGLFPPFPWTNSRYSLVVAAFVKVSSKLGPWLIAYAKKPAQIRIEYYLIWTGPHRQAWILPSRNIDLVTYHRFTYFYNAIHILHYGFFPVFAYW